MIPNDDDRRAADCACLEIHGENPDCPQHGVATSFALKHMTAEDWQMMVMDLRAELLASERRAYEKAAECVLERSRKLNARAVDAERTAAAIRALAGEG